MSPLSYLKLGALFVVVLVALGLYAGMEHYRASAVGAQITAAADRAQIAQMKADQNKIVSALERVAADTQSRSERTITIRSKIDAAPRTQACAGSPAIRAVLDGLRQSGAGAGAAASHP